MQELLADKEYHQVSQVIVLNTSRLWRSDMAKVLIQRELKKYNADVKAIEQPNYSIYTHEPNDFSEWPRGGQQVIQGTSNGLKFEGWKNPTTGEIESVYPVLEWKNYSN
ncbi:UNVERIFIED_CONTAM: hypothetical protein BJ099_1369 [Lysinibacillus xylanilyticus]